LGTLSGKVALITGAARGQGRAEAALLAEMGADIIAVDVCGKVGELAYPPSSEEDLAQTVRLVEAADRRIVARVVDVRDFESLQAAVDTGVAELGRLDAVIANAGISDWGRLWELTELQWQTMIDVNLTGVWHTLKATIPTLIAGGVGGSIVITSSVAGLKALPAQAHYSSAKHGLVGLTRAAAIELGEYNIRVNSIHPWGVSTPMATEDKTIERIFNEHPHFASSFSSPLAVPISSPEDIAQTVLYLVSDASRCVTGAQLPIDMGATKV
jgi:SDR family mycofactocin-dependent oxidoreductase